VNVYSTIANDADITPPLYDTGLDIPLEMLAVSSALRVWFWWLCVSIDRT
jgi:hypothetical protein